MSRPGKFLIPLPIILHTHLSLLYIIWPAPFPLRTCLPQKNNKGLAQLDRWASLTTPQQIIPYPPWLLSAKSQLIAAEWRIYAWIISLTLVQIMACRLVGTKPLSEPMSESCWLNPQEQTSVNFQSNFLHFHSRTCILKPRMLTHAFH